MKKINQYIIISILLLGVFSLLLVFPIISFALEIQRDKNIATNITFPLIDSSDDVSYKSGATGLDSEIDIWSDGVAPDGFIDCTNEATEISTTGIYYLSLTAAEMNADYIIVQIKGTDINTQGFLINTKIKEALDTAQADLDNPAQYKADVTNLDVAVSSRLAASAAPANFEDLAITVTTGYVTAGTVNDKSDYTISGTKTTLDALNDISAADVWGYATRDLTDKTGFSLSSAGIDAFWDEIITGHTIVDSFGKVFDDQIDGLRAYGDSGWATAIGFSTHTAADIWSVGTRALTDKANFTLSFSEYTNIWNKDISAYVGVGYAGTYLKDLWDKKPAGSMLSDTVWTATKAGYLDEAISSIDDNPWDNVTRTLTAGTKDTEIDSIKAYLETGGAIYDELYSIRGVSNRDLTVIYDLIRRR